MGFATNRNFLLYFSKRRRLQIAEWCACCTTNVLYALCFDKNRSVQFSSSMYLVKWTGSLNTKWEIVQKTSLQGILCWQYEQFVHPITK